MLGKLQPAQTNYITYSMTSSAGLTIFDAVWWNLRNETGFESLYKQANGEFCAVVYRSEA